MEKIKRFFHHYWLIILLTFLGAVLRLYRIEGTLQFLGDQGRDMIILRNLWVKHDLPFIGPVTSVGNFFLGPLYYYLMAPWVLLANFNPVGPAIATAFIGIITLPILYLITRAMLSPAAAAITCFLYALAAIPIELTRSAWNPNPMPLAALGIVFGFYQAQKTKKSKWLLLSAVSLGIALQLHYMIVFFGPFILWQLILVFKQPALRRSLFYWFSIIVLLMSPLILFELKNNFINVRGLFEYLTKNDYAKFNLWQTFKDLTGRSEQAIGMLLGFGEAFSQLRAWLTRLVWLPAIFLFFSQPQLGYRTVFLWLFVTIVSIAFFHGRIFPYYLAFLFPAVFMLAGEILSKLKGKLWPVAIGFIILFLVYNFPKIYQVLTSQGNLNSVKTTAQFIKADIDQHQYSAYNLALLDGTRDYPAHSFRYFLEVYGGQPLSQADYPQTQVLYVISPYQQTDVLNNPIWEIQSLQPAELVESWGFETSENIYKIERL
ncbi:MAG: glycosyltransferase family 39 protein [Candidatus Beckwithbacteria bacterium]